MTQNKTRKFLTVLILTTFIISISINYTSLISSNIENVQTELLDSFKQGDVQAENPHIMDLIYTVGILDSTDRGSYFTGGGSNDFNSINNGLISNGITTAILTNADIIAGELATVGLFILIDNVPNDDASEVLKTWCLNGGAIISFDSSICFLNWAGLLPQESAGTNGYNTYWDYDSPSSGVVIDNSHPVMKSYLIDETIYGTSGDAQYFSSSLVGTSIYPYYTPLVKSSVGSDYDLVVALDSPFSGRVVQHWDSHHWTTSSNQQMILDAINWTIIGSSGSNDIFVTLEVPSPIYIDETFSIDATIGNYGAYNETDVELILELDGVPVSGTPLIIPTLNIGETYTFTYSWTPVVVGNYNFTAIATPVFNESYISNNYVTKIIPVLDSSNSLGFVYSHGENTLDSSLKSYYEGLGYTVTDIYSTLTESLLNSFSHIFISESGSAWIASEIIALENYIISGGVVVSIADSPASDGIIQIASTYGINFTGLSTGSSGTTSVLDFNHPLMDGVTSLYLDSVYNALELDGSALPIIWDSTGTGIYGAIASIGVGYLIVLSDDFDDVLYDQDNEILFANILNQIHFDHDLTVNLDLPAKANIGKMHTITASVENSGTNPETDVSIYIYLNELIVASNTEVSALEVGESLNISYNWVPLTEGSYNFTAYSPPKVDEGNLQNNKITKIVNVVDIRNYLVEETTYSWFDAYENGDNLYISGDNTFGVIDLPFDFPFYGGIFSNIYVSSNGWLSFYDTSPVDSSNPTFPTEFYNYVVSPFWFDLEADNNIYVWSFFGCVVIEFHDFYYDYGASAGTFEVILFSNGDIIFQYQDIYTDDGVTVGLNYGLDLEYSTSYTDGLEGLSNLALKFTYEVDDETSPTISSPPDVVYVLDETGNTISWTASGKNSSVYFITRDGVEISSGDWENGVPITIDIDDLALGTYVYKITVIDSEGNYSTDVVKVTVINPDSTSPTLTSPSDLTYIEGEIRNTISWTASDAYPSTYVVTRDGIEISSGNWISGDSISINVDGLESGTYIFKITVYDLLRNSNSDVVTVTVEPVSTETPVSTTETGGFVMLISLLSLISVITIMKRRK